MIYNAEKAAASNCFQCKFDFQQLFLLVIQTVFCFHGYSASGANSPVWCNQTVAEEEDVTKWHH